jgi:phosphate transport system protein
MAIEGLVERNHALLAEVVSGDTKLDDLQIEIDDRCFTLIALQQPVAVDHPIAKRRHSDTTPI